MKLLRTLALVASLFSMGLPAQALEIPPSPVGRPPFLWGVSMSGFQNDGAAPSMDWFQLERSGKVPDQSGKSADFRGHMDADLDRAASLGLNAFRTSFEWARLEPEPGRFDPAEVAYCHHLLRAIKARGMTPIITLHHFVTPLWAYEDGGDGLLGWENPKTVEAYWRYVEFVAQEFGSEIDLYITFNEPSTVLLGGYTVGYVEPHLMGPVSLVRATQNMIKAHIGAYERIHRLDPVAQVSLSEYNAYFLLNDGLPDAGLPYMPGQLLGLLLDKARGWDGRSRVKSLDFLALHYYGSQDPSSASTFPVEPYRWGANPEQFGQLLRAYYKAFRLPILVAENGFATKNAEPRADGWSRESYLVAHVQELQAAHREGIPIMGYLYWTLTDNYEWGSFDPRFGLWRVEARQGDLTRHETPAVGVYREIIEHDGVTPELLRRFPPPASYQQRGHGAAPSLVRLP